MDIPRFRLEDAGLDFLLNPSDAIAADANQWEHYLAFIAAWRAALFQCLHEAVELEDNDTAKQINNMLVRLKEDGTFCQSMLKSLRHQ